MARGSSLRSIRDAMKSACSRSGSCAGLAFQNRCQNRRGTIFGSLTARGAGRRVASTPAKISSRCLLSGSNSRIVPSTTRPPWRSSRGTALTIPSSISSSTMREAVVGLILAASATARRDRNPNGFIVNAAKTSHTSRRRELPWGVTPSSSRSRRKPCSVRARGGRPLSTLAVEVGIPSRSIARVTRGTEVPSLLAALAIVMSISLLYRAKSTIPKKETWLHAGLDSRGIGGEVLRRSAKSPRVASIFPWDRRDARWRAHR